MISTGNFGNGGFIFKKSLGQNFIFDEGFLKDVVSKIGLVKDDTVVEIGTGAGTLTRVLARAVKRVVTYEIDGRLEQILQKQFQDFNNIELCFTDAMKVNDFPSSFKVIANIPYYITTPLIMKFLAADGCTEMCFLVQDDVARRITAKAGTGEYGALSVAVQSQAECRIIKYVPRNMFKPVPNVDSAFVLIKKIAGQKINGELVKGMFAARRKIVLNALKQALGITAGHAREILAKCGIDENIRPENITVDKYIELSHLIPR